MKKLTKITAFMLCAVMLCLSAAVFVSAEPDPTPAPAAQTITPLDSITVGISLFVGENVSNPNVPFYVGTVGSSSPAFVAADDTNYVTFEAGEVGTTNPLTKELIFNIDHSKFTAKGVYRVQFYQVATETQYFKLVPGVTYDSAKKYAYFYVDGNPAYDSKTATNVPKFICYACVVTESPNEPTIGADGKVSDEEFPKIGDGYVPFKNSYKSKSDDTEPNPDDPYPEGSLYDLSVTNAVVGSQADVNKEFNFSVELSGIKSTRDLYITKNGATHSTIPVELASATSSSTTVPTVTVSLKNGETFTIHGLNSGEKYKVTQTNGIEYTTSFSINNSAYDMYTGEITGEMSAEDTTIAFRNEKSGVIPTGIFLNYKHYWIMLGAALLLVAAFVGKRRNRVENEI